MYTSQNDTVDVFAPDWAMSYTNPRFCCCVWIFSSWRNQLHNDTIKSIRPTNSGKWQMVEVFQLLKWEIESLLSYERRNGAKVYIWTIALSLYLQTLNFRVIL